MSNALPKLHEAAEDLLRTVLFHPDENRTTPTLTSEQEQQHHQSKEGTTQTKQQTNGTTSTPVVHQRCNAFGLQSPLWVWTHRSALTQADCVTKETNMLLHLTQWFFLCAVDMSCIVLVMSRPVAQKLREKIAMCIASEQEALQRMTFVIIDDPSAAPSAFSAGENNGKIILISIGLQPTLMNGKLMTSKEEHISRWLFMDSKQGIAPTACILVGDAGWQVNSAWPNLALMISKLAKEKRIASGTTDSSICFPRLVASRLPVCCPIHPTERQLVSGNDRISGVCKRLCLKPFACGNSAHICLELCHPNASHEQCVYACNKVLACGHPCKMNCSAPCDCLHRIQQRLPCSHKVMTHLNDEMEPMFAEVPHYIRGSCANVDDLCDVDVTILCAKCSGKFDEKCHVVTAAGHGFDPSERTLVCPTCQKNERKIRAECRLHLMREGEERKKEAKAKLRDEMYHQRKAANSGIYQVGQKVVIMDKSKATDPLDPETDFPGIKFVDDVESEVQGGAHGVIAFEGTADIVDPTEFQYCVRLPSGKCTLVQGSGLQLIQAAAVSITSTNDENGAPRLLLTSGPTAGTDAVKAADEEGKDEEADINLPPVGSMRLLTHPVKVLGQATALVNCVVEVIGTDVVYKAAQEEADAEQEENEGDDATLPRVKVRCIMTDFSQAAEIAAKKAAERTQQQAEGEPTEDVELAKQRARTEENGATAATIASPRRTAAGTANDDIRAALTNLFEIHVVEADVPLAFLEPIPEVGSHVIISQPLGQIVQPGERKLLNSVIEDVLLGKANAKQDNAEHIGKLSLMKTYMPLFATSVAASAGALDIVALTEKMLRDGTMDAVDAHPIGADEPCILRGVLNWPTSPLQNRGPIFILELKKKLPTNKRGGDRKNVRRFVAMPTVFVSCDDEVAAEAALDAEMMAKLDGLFEERFAEDVEKRLLANEEALFVEQQKLPKPGSANSTKIPVAAYSVPVPLMDDHELAARKTAYAHLQHHTETKIKLAVKKDTLYAKKAVEKLDEEFWSKAKEQLASEDEALALWVGSIRKQLMAAGARR